MQTVFTPAYVMTEDLRQSNLSLSVHVYSVNLFTSSHHHQKDQTSCVKHVL